MVGRTPPAGPNGRTSCADAPPSHDDTLTQNELAEAAEPVALQAAHDSAADLFGVDTFRTVMSAEGRDETISVVTGDRTSAAVVVEDRSSGTRHSFLSCSERAYA